MEKDIQESGFRMWLLVIPAAFLIASAGYLVWSSTTGNFKLDVDLSGGTQITFAVPDQPDTASLERALTGYTPNIQTAHSLSGWVVSLNLPIETNTTTVLAQLSAAGWPVQEASVQSIGPALGATFFNQAMIAMVMAFIFMSITVYMTFRVPVPSAYVVLSAFADITEALAFSQLLGIRLSLATFAALLLLVGYSVDTDILLTARVLKGEGKLKELISRARKTGLTMTGTTCAALLALFAISGSAVITQIASVLLIGMLFDILNTWITNAGLLTWYVERKRSAV